LKLDRQEHRDADPRTLRAEQLRPRVEGDSLRVLAINVNATPATAPRKVGNRVNAAGVDRGWKHAGPAAEVEQVRGKMKAPSSAAVPAQATPQQGKPKRPEADLLRSNPNQQPLNPESAIQQQPVKESRKGRDPRQPAMRPVPPGEQPLTAPVAPKQSNEKRDKKGKPKGDIQPPAAQTAPQTQAPQRQVKNPAEFRNQPREQVQAPKVQKQKAEERIKPEQQAARPQEQRAARGQEQQAAKRQEQQAQPRKVENRPPSAPPAMQRQAPKQQAKAKGKDNRKDKGDRKPDSADQ
jgi:hypothetical protein